MTKDKIEQKAIKYFEQNPRSTAVFASSDGFLFLNKQDRNHHQSTLDSDQVFDFSNKVQAKEVVIASGFLENHANEVIAEIPNLTKDEIFSYLSEEKSGKARKTVIKALETALAEFESTEGNGLEGEEENSDEKSEGENNLEINPSENQED